MIAGGDLMDGDIVFAVGEVAGMQEDTLLQIKAMDSMATGQEQWMMAVVCSSTTVEITS